MRITGGTLRGRNLRTPVGQATRPTSDRVREALFNILAHHEWGDKLGDPLEGANVLDAFAGTGALGIEALSRGAATACFFEKDRLALSVLHANVEAFKLKDQAFILPADVTKPPRAHRPCTLVFLDPPYRKGLVPAALASLDAQGWLTSQSLLVIETAKNEAPELPPKAVPLLARTYGDTSIGFYQWTTEE